MPIHAFPSPQTVVNRRRESEIGSQLLGWIPVVATSLAGAIGVLGLLSHSRVSPSLLAFAPQLQGIKFNTALCLLALSIALASGRFHGTALRWTRVGCAAFPILVGCATLAEYVFGIDLHIDQLVVRDIVPGFSAPGRMGFNTGLCLVLLGASLVFDAPWRRWFGPIAVSIAGAIAIFVLIGHAFGLEAPMRVALLGEMSMSAAVAIFLLCVGVLSLPATAKVLQNFVLSPQALLMGFGSLMLLLAATSWLYLYLSSAALRLASQAFAVECAPVSNEIAASVDHATQELVGARGLFAASNSVSRTEWHEYVVGTQVGAAPGIMGFGFSRWIEPQELARHEREVRAEGFPDYAVKPAGERAVYTSILYLEPLSGQNLRAFGYDMYSDPIRREAMDRAMATRSPAISAPVQLVQNDIGDTQPGFLIYVPVYSQPDSNGTRRFLGFAYSPVRIADLLSTAISRTRHEHPRIGFDVVDAATPDRPLFRFPGGASVTTHSLYRTRAVLPLAQRRWIVSFYSLPSFEKTYRSFGPDVALYAGISLSIAMVTLAFLLFGYRTKARTLAHRTGELGFQLALNGAVTEQMADPVFVMDLDGRVTFSNAAVQEHFGFSRAELQGCPLHRTIHHHHADGSSFPEDECPIVQSLHGRTLLNYDTIYLRKGGDPMNVIVSATPLYVNGDQVGAVVVAHDITARKLAEEALIRSNQELQRFAYVASHDLQTPLRSIASFTQLLEDSSRDHAQPRELDWMKRIVHNTRKMERLIASLLEYARVGASNRAFIDVDLNVVVANVLEMLQPQLLECGAGVVVDPLPMVHGEATQLAQLFQNLIGNAIKYRSERPLHIEVRNEQCGSEYCISVKDNGIGIDPQFRDQIFEPFKRLHTDRHYTGTGVGLAICRRVVERHGGRLWVKSTPDDGSGFYFTLPMRAQYEPHLLLN